MSRRARITLSAALALLLAGTSGCALLGGTDWRGHRRALKDQQLKYAHLLRWGEYDAASMLVHPDDRERFREELKPFSDLRLSDYEVIHTEFNAAGSEADVLVAFSAYHVSRLIEHRWVENQHWARDPATGQWTVRPDFEKIRVVLARLHARP